MSIKQYWVTITQRLCLCVLQQKQIRKAHNGKERTWIKSNDVRVEKVMEVFTRKTTGPDAVGLSLHLGQLIQGIRRCTVAGVQCKKYCIWYYLCSQTRLEICSAGIKHLRWRTSAKLQIAKPVNQSEISRDCDNTPNRLHIWDFHLVMFSIALLCRHTVSCKIMCSFGFCIHCWKDCGKLQLWQAVLWFCICTGHLLCLSFRRPV